MVDVGVAGLLEGVALEVACALEVGVSVVAVDRRVPAVVDAGVYGMSWPCLAFVVGALVAV